MVADAAVAQAEGGVGAVAVGAAVAQAVAAVAAAAVAEFPVLHDKSANWHDAADRRMA